MAGKPTRALDGDGLPSWRPITSAARRERHWCFGDSSRWRRRPLIAGAAVSRPDAATPTRGSTPHRRWAGRPSTPTRPTAASRPPPAPTSLKLSWTPLGQGRSRGRGRARLGQLSGGQRPDRRRLLADGVGERQQRRASAGAPGSSRAAGSSSPLFDGFDNLYVGQPGLMLSFPPTQWIRWRQPGDRNAIDAKASRQRSTAGGDPSRSGAGVRRPPRRRRGQPDRPGRRHRPDGFATRSGRLPAGPAEVPDRRGARFLGGHPDDRHPRLAARRTGATVLGAAIPTRARRRCWHGRGPATPSPTVCWQVRCCPPTARRSTSTAATNSCGRSTPTTAAEMVGAAGLPGADAAHGGAGGTDHRRRRPGHRAGGDQGRGDHAEVVWRRGDVIAADHGEPGGRRRLHRASRTATNGHGAAGVLPADGHTVNSYPLPEATGLPVGVSIGHDRRVVAATSDGQVYGFAPAS